MKKPGTHIIYTIGHSTHSLAEFLDMLQSFDIKILADIRSLPGSRKFPQFDKEKIKNILRSRNTIHTSGRFRRKKKGKKGLKKQPLEQWFFQRFCWLYGNRKNLKVPFWNGTYCFRTTGLYVLRSSLVEMSSFNGIRLSESKRLDGITYYGNRKSAGA